MPPKRLFGTDGIRGRVPDDLGPVQALKLGMALGASARREGRAGKVLIGKDTRLSSDMLEAALAAGVAAFGYDVLSAGVIPTPGVCYLTRARKEIAFGVMISASHNPPEDNGIKIFRADGLKLSDREEAKLEQWYFGAAAAPSRLQVGAVRDWQKEARRLYLRHLRKGHRPFPRWRIVADAAHGAVAPLAREVFESLGIEAVVLHDKEDGGRINVRCGALHPRALLPALKRTRAVAGFAFDGDADRVQVLTEKGELLNGDDLMAMIALDWQRRGKLAKNEIVVTTMSNRGMLDFLRAQGVRARVTPVGDRYVLDALLRRGLGLGGEQAGHILFPQEKASSDGLFTALQVLRIMHRSGKPLSELGRLYQPYPQIIESIKVKEKETLAEDPAFLEAVCDARNRVGRSGRVVVRPSGTEPKIRVMIECRDEALARKVAEDLAARARQLDGGR